MVLIKYEDRFWVRSPLSISQIFLNKKRRNLKKGETIDRYSFERRNQGGGEQKKWRNGQPKNYSMVENLAGQISTSVLKASENLAAMNGNLCVTLFIKTFRSISSYQYAIKITSKPEN